MSIYSELFCKKANKQIAILVDPDKGNDAHFAEIAQTAQQSAVDYIFVGGSLLTKDNMDTCIETIKKYFFAQILLSIESKTQYFNSESLRIRNYSLNIKWV